jgi:hypothetical protein
MPLRDHFRPPVSQHHSWDEFVVTLDLEASYEETCRVLRIA